MKEGRKTCIKEGRNLENKFALNLEKNYPHLGVLN
jgi:hypothetical protein